MSYATSFSSGTTNDSVSREWARRPNDEKFLSLGEMLAYKRDLTERSIETVADLRKVAIMASPSNPTLLGFGIDGKAYEPTNWSFRQFCSQVKAPASYIANEMPGPLAASMLQIGAARHGEDSKVLLTGDKVRAFTGPKYGRIWDADVIEAVMKVAGNGTGDATWKVPGCFDWSSVSYNGGASRATYNPNVPVTKETTTLFASDRDMFLFLCDDQHPIEVGKLPDGSPDLMFRGFIVWNSETSARTLGIATMYLRGVCCNRILWGVEGYQEFALRHNENAPGKFLEQALPAFNTYANASPSKLIAGVKAAKGAILGKDDREVEDWLVNSANLDFTRAQASRILATGKEEEGFPVRTVWDAAQGITAMARKIGFGDDRYDLEMKGRKLLDRVTA